MVWSIEILVVDDEPQQRHALERLLRAEGYGVRLAHSVPEALAHLDDGFDLIVSELSLNGRQEAGIELLREWKAAQPLVPFMIVTAHGSIETAVASIKMGAEDFLAKPVPPGPLLAKIRECLSNCGRLSEREAGFEHIIARSEVMLNVFDQTRRAAQTDSTVLIVGESGTGKELIAEAIHRLGPRSTTSFVTVNMAAIPENLVEAELFGHCRGAFTGATQDRQGRFQAAEKGTLFIDEIGDFHLSSQAKLLRALESGVVSPVGTNDEQVVDARVVAATSRDLYEMLADGTFREDLYYRLNVITITLPPLRERREDIPKLTQAFLAEICAATERSPLTIDERLMEFLEDFDWPGNVRQLRNCVESMVVMARQETLTLDDVPDHLTRSPMPDERAARAANSDTLDDLERVAIQRALKQCDGNRTRAAQTLGISVRTLQRRLRVWRQQRKA